MRNDSRFSTTAVWVSCLRGLAGLAREPLVSDPFAEHLVPAGYATLLRSARRAPRPWRHSVQAGIARASSQRHSWITFRTRAIDDAIAEAVARGVEQVVLLGAGLDARAYRMAGLERATVYEIDHPATQAYKRARIAAFEPRAAQHRFVGVSFEHDCLESALATSGHDASRPTVFVWEGVTNYLSPEAIEQVLGAVARRSASGSVLLMTYCRPSKHLAEHRFAAALVRRAGEPYRTMMSPSGACETVGAHGYRVVSDEGYPEWARKYRGHTVTWDYERLVHAVRA